MEIEKFDSYRFRMIPTQDTSNNFNHKKYILAVYQTTQYERLFLFDASTLTLLSEHQSDNLISSYHCGNLLIDGKILIAYEKQLRVFRLETFELIRDVWLNYLLTVRPVLVDKEHFILAYNGKLTLMSFSSLKCISESSQIIGNSLVQLLRSQREVQILESYKLSYVVIKNSQFIAKKERYGFGEPQIGLTQNQSRSINIVNGFFFVRVISRKFKQVQQKIQIQFDISKSRLSLCCYFQNNPHMLLITDEFSVGYFNLKTTEQRQEDYKAVQKGYQYISFVPVKKVMNEIHFETIMNKDQRWLSPEKGFCKRMINL